MSKEARNKQPVVSSAVAEKIMELAELIARDQFGPQGVPIDITFAEIEEIGHQAGRIVAAEVDQKLTADHQEHFIDEHQPCPKCERMCPAQPYDRKIKTRDGTMVLSETVCDCPDCRRSFFPSARSVEA